MPHCLRFSITDSEKSKLRTVLSRISYDSRGSDDYLFKLKTAFQKHAPQNLLKILFEQRSASNPYSYIIFENLPIDQEVISSPNNQEKAIDFKSGNISENLLCAFGISIGEPYSIKFEGNELVNNLTPQKSTAKDFTGLGSKVELALHIENAALKFANEESYSPMGLLLTGVRSDPQNNPNTVLADGKAALALLEDKYIKILRSKRYIIKLPYRWRNTLENLHTPPVSMVTGPNHAPNIHAVFYPDMVTPIDKSAKIAFEYLHKALKKVAVYEKITPGKLVYINNYTALHARERFDAAYDDLGKPYRWIQRLFIAENLWAFRRFKKINDRIYDPSQIQT